MQRIDQMNSILVKKLTEVTCSPQVDINKMLREHHHMENVRRLRDQKHARFANISKLESMLKQRRSSWLLAGQQRSERAATESLISDRRFSF